MGCCCSMQKCSEGDKGLSQAKHRHGWQASIFLNINNKRNTRENIGLLLNVTGTLETEAAEKADMPILR